MDENKMTLCTARFTVLALILLALPAFSVQAAETLSITVTNNTPLFEDAGCVAYKGKEAIRSMFQLIASTRMRLEVHAFDFESEPFNGQLLKKARAGQSVTMYSQSGRFPEEFVSGFNVRMITVGDNQERGPLIIRSDNTFVGIGNIPGGHPKSPSDGHFKIPQ